MATILGVSKDTLERRYAAVMEKGRANALMSLRHKQFQIATGGNVSTLIMILDAGPHTQPRHGLRSF